MVRTKNTAVRIGNKAPRKAISTPALDLKGKGIADLFKSKSSGGDAGNPYCPRERPTWQKEITKFFIPATKTEASASGASSSSQDSDPVGASEDCATVSQNNDTKTSTSEDCGTASQSNDTKT